MMQEDKQTPKLVMGKVYLIPTTLGETAPLEVLPISVKWNIENIDHYIVENEKTARRFIKKISPNKPQPSLHIETINKYTDPSKIPSYLDPCIHGFNVGVISEAGCPAIADPGSLVVQIAHEKKIQVVPLVGPSSILMAMMSSGMNGQNFAFNGYLPIEPKERKAKIKALEKASRETGQTQLFMETPYRNDKLLVELIKILQRGTRLCIASDISLPSEFIKTKTVHEWSEIQLDLNKRPTIFIVQA